MSNMGTLVDLLLDKHIDVVAIVDDALYDAEQVLEDAEQSGDEEDELEHKAIVDDLRSLQVELKKFDRHPQESI